MASPLRLNTALIEAAEREGAVQKRSVPKQIEYWADLGKAVQSLIDPADVVAVIQGIKRIKVEPVASIAVDPGDVFDPIETDRKSGALGKEVTSAMTLSKQLWVLAGGNGAGKTTFHRLFLAPRGIKLLNADLIAAKINPESPEKAGYEAAHLISRLGEDLLNAADILKGIPSRKTSASAP